MRSRAEVEIFMRHVLNELELRRPVYLDLGKNEIKWALEFLDTVKGVSWASGDIPSKNAFYFENNLKRFLVIDKREDYVFNESVTVLTFMSEPFPRWVKPFQGYAMSEADNNFRRHI